MSFRQLLARVLSLTFLMTAPATLVAAGTDIVATKGQPVVVASSWPKGVGDLVNDPSRTSGWNSWFAEWPNESADQETGFDAIGCVSDSIVIFKRARWAWMGDPRSEREQDRSCVFDRRPGGNRRMV